MPTKFGVDEHSPITLATAGFIFSRSVVLSVAPASPVGGMSFHGQPALRRCVPPRCDSQVLRAYGQAIAWLVLEINLLFIRFKAIQPGLNNTKGARGFSVQQAPGRRKQLVDNFRAEAVFMAADFIRYGNHFSIGEDVGYFVTAHGK